jgi:formamidopyrimidine-DNA glycosylase
VPELPVVQALAERLDGAVGEAELAGVTPLQFSALKTFDPDPATLVGRTLVGVTRRGKYLVLDLDGPRILVHLGQGGRVDIEDPPRTTRPRNGVVRLAFESRPAVLVKEHGTERRAGWWVVAGGDDGPLAELGPEPDSEAFADLVRHGDDRRRLHTILRDQRTVAGIGRGHADDILHRARLSPFATLASLDAEGREELLRAVADDLADGLAAERRREGGLPAKLGDHWRVHHRHGEPCPSCGATLQRISYESHEVTYCPPCQTGGKVLADRRMSRLLK